MPTHKVIYFGMPGRAEAIRLSFGLGGIEFEDKQLTGEEWGAMKPTVAPFLLPLLEVDGKMISQSAAQTRYAGKLAKVDGKALYPEDPMEALLVDEMCDKVSECFTPLMPTFGITDLKEREEARAALVKIGGPVEKWAAHIDSIIGKNTSGFAVLDRLTTADIVIFTALSGFRIGFLDGISKDCFDHLKNVIKHKEKISALPQVKEYYKNAKGPFAYFQ